MHGGLPRIFEASKLSECKSATYQDGCLFLGVPMRNSKNNINM